MEMEEVDASGAPVALGWYSLQDRSKRLNRCTHCVADMMCAVIQRPQRVTALQGIPELLALRWVTKSGDSLEV